MSSTKNLSPYMAIVVAGIIGFQSFAIGQINHEFSIGEVAPDTRQVDPSTAPTSESMLPTGRSTSASLKGRSLGLLVTELTEKEAQLFDNVLSPADSARLKEWIGLKNTLVSTAQGLRKLEEKPILNPSLPPWANSMLNTCLRWQFILNQVSQFGPMIKIMERDERLKSAIVAAPLVLGAAVKLLSDPNALANPQKVYSEINEQVIAKYGHGIVSEETQKDVGQIIDFVKQISENKSISEGVRSITEGPSEVNGVANYLTAIGSVIYFTFAMASHKFEVVSKALRENKELVDDVKVMYEGLSNRMKKTVHSTAAMGGNKSQHGSVAASSITEFAALLHAFGSQDTVRTAQIVSADLMKPIMRLNNRIAAIKKANNIP